MARPLAVTGGVLFVTLWFLGLLPHAALLPLTVCAGVLCALVLCVRALRRKGLLPYVCAVVLAGCVLFWFHYDFVFAPVAALGGRTVPVTAALADLPQQLDDGYRTVLRTDSVDGMPMRCRIALYTSQEPEITCRQTVTFRTRLEANSAPGSSGVWLRAYEMRDARYTDDASGFFGRMLAVRQYAIETLLQRLPGTNGAVLAAMITGSEQYIPDDVYARMLECGIVHIFSVSGLHLSVFSMLLYRFLERRRAPRAVIALPSAVLTFLLMAVTGFSYSCVRAGIMLYIMLLGRCFFWRSDGLNALGASILVMVLIDPFCAGSVGLQLSVLGTLGVILASPIVETRVETLRVRPRFLRKPIRLFLSALLVSACIHILTLPVIVIEFRRLSLVSPLANACLLFAAEWAMITAAAAVLLSAVPFLGVLSKPLLFGAGLLAKYCVLVSDSFGKLPFAAVRSDFAGLRFWIVGTLIVVVLGCALAIGTYVEDITDFYYSDILWNTETLWWFFGAANLLLAAMALMSLSLWLKQNGKASWMLQA
ncbi:MAG: ComEC/Rec2 family competence protein, partial [Clostridia bacterium]|nr:ComEC/Rec2 family competence protein [Clostridia bacterium]